MQLHICLKTPLLPVSLSFRSICYRAGVIDHEELIFSRAHSNDIRWELLMWTLDLDSAIKDHLMRIPKTYYITVLALTFLVEVCDYLPTVSYINQAATTAPISSLTSTHFPRELPSFTI